MTRVPKKTATHQTCRYLPTGNYCRRQAKNSKSKNSFVSLELKGTARSRDQRQFRFFAIAADAYPAT
jgi:hypothetical protein